MKNQLNNVIQTPFSNGLPNSQEQISRLQSLGLLDQNTANLLSSRINPFISQGMTNHDNLIPQMNPIQTEKEEVSPVNSTGNGQKDFQKYIETQNKANELGYELEQKRAQEQQSILHQQMQQAYQEAQQAQQIQQKVTNIVDTQIHDTTESINKYNSMQLNPERFLDKGANRILATLSVALGSMGSALAGTPNYALQIVNDHIDRDLKAQIYEIEKAGHSINLKNNMYAQALQGLGHQQTALEFAHAMEQNKFAKHLDYLSNTMLPGEAQKKMIDLSAQLYKQSADTMEQMKINQSNIVHQRVMEDISRQGLESERQKNQLESLMHMQTAGRVPAEQAVKLGEAGSIIKNIDQTMKKFEELTGKGSALTQHLPMTDAKKYNSWRDGLALNIKFYMSGKGSSDKETQQVIDLIPYAGDSKSIAKNKIEQIKSLISNKALSEEEGLTKAGYRAEGISGIQSRTPGMKKVE